MTARFLVTAISTATSALGWWLGEQLGLMSAVLLGMVGLGVGIWLGRRVVDRLIG